MNFISTAVILDLFLLLMV